MIFKLLKEYNTYLAHEDLYTSEEQKEISAAFKKELDKLESNEKQ